MSSEPQAKTPVSLATRLRYGALAIVALLVLIIVAQNTESVQTNLLFFSITLPRAVLLFITFLIGFVLGWLVHFRRR